MTNNFFHSQNIYLFSTDDNIQISSGFGERVDPITGVGTEHHNGVDFATPIGTDVHAIKPGTVYKIGYQDVNDPNVGFGLRLWVKYEDGTEGFYSHMSSLEGFQVGDRVVPGQLVGQSGDSGRSSGPHFHYAERIQGTQDGWIDPTPTLNSALKLNKSDLVKLSEAGFYFNDIQTLPSIEDFVSYQGSSLENFYAINPYLSDRRVDLSDGSSVYLFKEDDKLKFTAVDNDYEYTLPYDYDGQDGMDVEVSRDLSSSETSELLGKVAPLVELSGETGDVVGRVTVNGEVRGEIYKGLLEESLSESLGSDVKIGEGHSDYYETTISGEDYSILRKGANAVVDGVSIAVSALQGMVDRGGEYLAQYVDNVQLQSVIRTFANKLNIEELSSKLAAGLILGRSAEEIAREFAIQKFLVETPLELLAVELVEYFDMDGLESARAAIVNNAGDAYPKGSGNISISYLSFYSVSHPILSSHRTASMGIKNGITSERKIRRNNLELLPYPVGFGGGDDYVDGVLGKFVNNQSEVVVC